MTRLKQLALAGVLVISVAAYATDLTSSTKSMGGILDTYGCLASQHVGGAHGSHSFLATTTLEVGANWNGSQYQMAIEPQNSPAKQTIEVHTLTFSQIPSPGPGGDWSISVNTACDDNASGQATWLVPFEDWWFSPACNVAQVAPILHTSADGQEWTQVPLVPMDGDDLDMLGSATVGAAGQGTGIRYATSNGSASPYSETYWISEQVSGNSSTMPEFARATFEFQTTTSGSCDNATATNFKVWLSAGCFTTITIL